MSEDSGMIRKCLAGDRLALNELFCRYEGRVYGLCFQMVRRLWWQWLRRKEVDKEWRKSTLSIT